MFHLSQVALILAAFIGCAVTRPQKDAMYEETVDGDESSVEMNYQPSHFEESHSQEAENDNLEYNEEELVTEGRKTIKVQNFGVSKVIRLTYRAPGPLRGSWLLLNLMSNTGDILLHINPRYYKTGPILVMNSYLNGAWGREERPRGFPFTATNVQIVVNVEEDGYRITANGGTFTYLFKHRRAYSEVSSIGTDIYDIQYGVIISWDSYADNKIGKVVYVKGVAPGSDECGAGVCAVNIIPATLPVLASSGPNNALHFNPRFSSKYVVRNTYNKGAWGPEETSGGMPLTPKSPFIVAITVQQDRYEIAVNGKHFCSYSHRIPLNGPVLALVTPSLLGTSVSVQVI